MGVNLKDARIEVKKSLAGDRASWQWKFLYPTGKRVLELSLEARQLGHNYIGTEHLLLG